MVTPSYLAAPARLARSPEAPSTGSPLPPMGLRQHEMQRLLADRRAQALSQLPPQAPTLLLSSPPGTLPACSGPAEFQPRKSLTPFSRICGQQCSRASPSLPIHPPPPGGLGESGQVGDTQAQPASPTRPSVPLCPGHCPFPPGCGHGWTPPEAGQLLAGFLPSSQARLTQICIGIETPQYVTPAP